MPRFLLALAVLLTAGCPSPEQIAQICRSQIPTYAQPVSPSCTYVAMEVCRACYDDGTTAGCAFRMGTNLCCLGDGWDPEPSADEIATCLGAWRSAPGGLCVIDRTTGPVECAWLWDRLNRLTGCP